MTYYKYLIVGGGMTGISAANGIREIDPEGSIGMISTEPDPPYNRPPLTKGLWKGKPVSEIWRKTPQRNFELLAGCPITGLDPETQSLTAEDGTIYKYDKLLLATGGTPRTLPFEDEGVIYYRTFRDYERLRTETDHKQRFIVIGGGFIGAEIAAALKLIGKDVVMVLPEEGIGSAVYPEEISRYLITYYREQGIDVITGEFIVGMQKHGDQFLLTGKSGREITADATVAGIGIRPNIQLAKSGRLKIGNGIAVDEYLRTSDPNIYAAGDVAEFYNPTLDKRIRVEHEDNANTMGLMAGKNMAGETIMYEHLPMFYSDLFDIGYEAVGELNSKMDTFIDWQEPFKKGVIYYLEGSRVRGVLLWNVWDQVDHARALIAEQGPFNGDNLKGRLPL
jgi:3-phenylpropionate/trans-cinnamate dioxygenase ferredoxin reductase subunit